MRRLAPAAVLAVLAGCGETPPADETSAEPRGYGVVREYAPVQFDGDKDDLLTGGLGLDGLRRMSRPEGASLRTLAVWYNFRAIVDVADEGGFGRLAGPAPGEEKIAGEERIAVLALPGAAHPFSVALQIPVGFDPDAPCLVIGPSSGSRGVYGAIGTASAWGLPRGCAVVLVDKMTGGGVYHLATEEGYDAMLALRDAASGALLFKPADSTALAAYTERRPDALAVKHAHSRDNVERHWGASVLAAGRYALDVLDTAFPEAGVSAETTIVIAASISNGGRAVLAAAEADADSLIDGVVAGEPNVVMAPDREADFLAYAAGMNLFAPCAALAEANAGRPGYAATQAASAILADWCGRLADDGRATGASPADQAADAMARVRALGFLPETDDLVHYGVAIRLWPAVAALYSNAYGRYGVEDELCGVRYAYASQFGAPRPPRPEEKRTHAALSSGSPPVAGVGLVADPATPEGAYDAAACFHDLASANRPERVEAGIAETISTGRPSAPTIVLHGRADALVPVTRSSRPYAEAALAGEAPFSYLEIEHGQHFDAFLPFPDLGARFVPMHVYFEAAADMMLEHLRDGAPLPQSQVVRTAPRGEGAPPLTRENAPALSREAGAADRIGLSAEGLVVPD